MSCVSIWWNVCLCVVTFVCLMISCQWFVVWNGMIVYRVFICVSWYITLLCAVSFLLSVCRFCWILYVWYVVRWFLVLWYGECLLYWYRPALMIVSFSHACCVHTGWGFSLLMSCCVMGWLFIAWYVWVGGCLLFHGFVWVLILPRSMCT